MEPLGGEHRPGIYRIQLSAYRLPHFQVNLSASNSGPAHGVRRFGLANIYVACRRLTWLEQVQRE
jgi:hypothetical protein